MAELRDKIEKIRFNICNTEKRYFIPETTLFDVVTESAVKQSLRSLQIPLHEINDVTTVIVQGARKCFAILLLIGRGEAITSFIKHDSLQRQSFPDYLLPYTTEQLQQRFEEKDDTVVVSSFLEKQWEFAIPIMQRLTVFRKLDASAILPFLREELAGRGSMGTAWKVELHPQCHHLPLEHHIVIRKEIELRERDSMSSFQKELENLALLGNLKHDNIVQLYCAYMYRERYNLIFALADGGSLADLLDGKNMEGPKDSQLLLALAELASAIDALHNFTSETLNLKLSGCHHDLAPRNILVHKDTFLLADFGLSSLRNAEEDSLTLFKDVRGSYLAPECQILQDGHFITSKISRASDIWSFGCILSEVLTYMKYGPDGVNQFRSERVTDVTSDVTWSKFHRGPGRSNPAIEPWLDRIQSSGESYCVRMVSLIRKMLSMDSKERPRSAEVLMVLRGIWIVSFGNSIQLALDSIHEARPTIDGILNQMRFRGWLLAFHQLLDDGDHKEMGSPEFDFSKTVHALKEIHHILKDGVEVNASIRHQQQSLLRYQHAKLIAALPSSYRRIAKEHLETLLLRDDDVEQLGDVSTAMKTEGDEDIGVLVAVKRLMVLANNNRLIGRNDLFINPGDVAFQENVDIHDLALLGPASEPVLVEWLKYKGPWADEDTGRELRQRLTSVIELLHAESTAKIPGSLHCRGMFHNPSEQAFGIVYELPLPREKLFTLHQLLSAPKSPYRPLLECRFQLAFDICQCIFTFHKVGWLHRNLHSMNILFFPSDGAEKAQWAKKPRIVGFAGSRESALNSFTHGPEDNGQLRKYQHPTYLTRQKRYREVFDYYSIGMLLLEIGLWSTLAEITRSNRFQGLTDDEFRREIVTSRVPHLGVTMGTRYMEATRICLDNGFVGNESDLGSEKEALCAAFKNQVIDQILIMK